MSSVLENARALRDMLGHYASGITVIGGLEDRVPIGFTCQSFYAVSLEPPLVSFSVMKTSSTYPRIRANGKFSVNVLAHDQQDMSNQFAGVESGRWADVTWALTLNDNPVIGGTLVWIDCDIWEEYDVGDHFIVIGRINDMSPIAWPSRDPLIYYKGQYRGLDAAAPAVHTPPISEDLPPDISTMASLTELGSWAEDRWSQTVRSVIQQGAGTSASVRANVEAWSGWALRARILHDVSDVDITTTLLGRPMRTPIAVAPSGQHTMVRPEGEVSTAEGAKDFDTLMVLSAGTGRPIEDVRSVGGRTWFQFYWGRDRERVRDNLQRAVEQGCEAVCMTVDLPVPPIIDSHLRAAVQNIPGPPPQYVLPRDAHVGGEWDHDASLTWKDLDWLRTVVDVPIVLKGVTTAEDARATADAGIDAIVVSNHGGRTQDYAVPTAHNLVEVIEALRGLDNAPEVIVDGGIRRGRDVLIARALGARAVLVGRPVLWGLAADGADGVRDVLALLERQLRTEMAMTGYSTLADLTPAVLVRHAW